jgi:hypothetical protein
VTDDYAWLAKECEFRLTVNEPGFTTREVVPVGRLYDVCRLWLESDGTIAVADLGPQDVPEWDSDRGHGAIWRLGQDDVLTSIVPPSAFSATVSMPLYPHVAPEHFGRWGGHLFYVGQTVAGRTGAHSSHGIWRIAPGEQTPFLFGLLPNSGTEGGGVAGASMFGDASPFGPAGSPHEGYGYAQSLMNRTLYQFDADANIRPYYVFDDPAIMPVFCFFAPPILGKLEGDLIVGGLPQTSYTQEARREVNFSFWRMAGPHERPEPVEIHWGLWTREAPPEFGRFGGHLFFDDPGSTNLLHATKMGEGPLPYDARIMRVDPDGNVHTFAEGLQGPLSLCFNGDRLYVGMVRKSFSTGEYHAPDGGIYEIRYDGRS